MWIPIMDYAIKHKVSVSTLRRRIKSKKIRHRLEHGRYLLWDSGDGLALSAADAGVDEFEAAHAGVEAAKATYQGDEARLRDKLKKLEMDLKKAQEEVAELKMLVALYEDRIRTPQDHS